MTMLKKASTNVVRYFMMRLTATGKAATGLTITTFDMQYTRELTASATSTAGIVGTGGATTHVDNKVFELDATNSPGLYMVCFADAAFATGVDQVILNVTYDTTVFTEGQTIQLVDFDPFDTVRMGLTALPNFAAGAAGGLPDDTDANGAVRVVDGTGAREINTNAGAIALVDLVTTLTTYTGNTLQTADVASGVTLAAGAITNASLAGNMEIVFETDFATNYNTTRNGWATNTQDLLGTGAWNVGKTGYSLTTADWNVGKTGYSLTATTGLGAQTANITGNLSGSVGSNLELGPAEVNTEVDNALETAMTELGVGSPTATPNVKEALMLLYMALRNQTIVQTSGIDALEIYNDAGTKITQKTLTDDGSDYTEGKMG